ncbi:serine--tRNA ligase [Candidatus Pacearchaeota archaeon]|nr:serine--tRNA ligase [Candidatus Pacearchaeota archaeon]
MIDIKLIRESPDLVKENIKKKFQEEKLVLVDKVKKLDEEWRKIKHQEDNLRSERNKISEKINQLKKEKKDVSTEIKNAKEIPGKISSLEEKRKKLEEEIRLQLMLIPNIIDSSVPLGKDASQNVEVKKIGKMRNFEFVPKNHIELGEALGVLDFDDSADVSGKGFYYLKGELAILNQALISFARDYMIKAGFQYVEPPLMIRKEILDGVVSFADIDNMIYKVEGEDLYLIGTSEHSLIGQFINKTLNQNDLPILQTAYSMCFRREVGSHGVEEKGLFRTHQFNKQEMIVICEPTESRKWFDKMSALTVDFFSKLEIPMRILEMCSGDLGDLKNKQVDIEAWSPIKKEYYEVGSCSNLTDAQARRLGIKIENKGERYYTHTLNNTVIATSRALVAILENFQQKDGSVKIPNALWKYTGFKEIKPKTSMPSKLGQHKKIKPKMIQAKKIILPPKNEPLEKVSKAKDNKKLILPPKKQLIQPPKKMMKKTEVKKAAKKRVIKKKAVKKKRK